MAITKNPKAKKKTLQEYWKSYRRIRKNPPVVFEKYLAQHGDVDFTHKQWITFIEDTLGITDPVEQIEYMDQIAEWL